MLINKLRTLLLVNSAANTPFTYYIICTNCDSQKPVSFACANHAIPSFSADEDARIEVEVLRCA